MCVWCLRGLCGLGPHACYGESAGCDEPACFHSGGTVAVCVLLAVLALGAAAYMMKNDAGTRARVSTHTVNIWTARLTSNSKV